MEITKEILLQELQKQKAQRDQYLAAYQQSSGAAQAIEYFLEVLDKPEEANPPEGGAP